jgi:predicted extracellular nuclease
VGEARTDADPVHGRRPLAQAFERVAAGGAGARFEVVVVHFKSRRCEGADGEEADQGDLQGCWNRRRVRQARAVRAFAKRLADDTGIADTLLLGDFNAYPREEPLAELAGRGFVDAAARLEPGGYSFVHDGAAGRLDQVLASDALAPRVAGVATWHIDADELPPAPDRASDHDPVLVGLALP